MKRGKIRAMGLLLSTCMLTGSLMPGTAVIAAEQKEETAYEAMEEESQVQRENEEVTNQESREGETEVQTETETETDSEKETDPPAELPKAETPNAEFDAATMLLSKVDQGMKYSVDGGSTWIPVTDTSVDLSKAELSAEKDIRVIRMGTENVSTDSEAQFLDLLKPAVPAQPEVTVGETTVSVKAVDGQEYAFQEAASTAEAAWGTDVEFNSLKEGTNYVVRTRVSGKGLSLPSDAASVEVTTKIGVLARPEGVAAKMVDTGTIKITWSAVEGAETYTVYRSDDDKRTYQPIQSVKELEFTDTAANGLVSGKNYYYRIVAFKEVNGVSYNSAASLAKKGFTKLETPTLKLQQKNKANVLTWTEVPNAQLYRVYRSTSKNSGYTKIATVSEPTYTDKSFVRDTRYYYKVRATRQVSKVYYSAYSNLKRSERIKKPNIIHKEQIGSKARIIWAKYIYADGAVVYQKKAGEKYKKVDTITDGQTRFTSEDLTAGTYYFRVRYYKVFNGKKAYGAYGKTQKFIIK